MNIQVIILIVVEVILFLSILYACKRIYDLAKSGKLEKTTGYIIVCIVAGIFLFSLPGLFIADIDLSNFQSQFGVGYVDDEAVTIVQSDNTLVITNKNPEDLVIDISCNDCVDKSQKVIKFNQVVVIDIERLDFENMTITNYKNGDILGIIS